MRTASTASEDGRHFWSLSLQINHRRRNRRDAKSTAKSNQVR